LAIYGISFFLAALGATSQSPGDQPFYGFYCAMFSFCYPWVEARAVLFHYVPPVFGLCAYISLLVSGWVNPLFLFVALLDLADFQQRLASILRKVILGMFPFAWFFAFYELHAFPREGHFLWIVGMLLTLYPKQFTPNADSMAD
jgi:hypothetical protein